MFLLHVYTRVPLESADWGEQDLGPVPVCRVSARWLDISHLMVLLDVCMCMSQSQIYRQWVGPGACACLQGEPALA